MATLMSPPSSRSSSHGLGPRVAVGVLVGEVADDALTEVLYLTVARGQHSVQEVTQIIRKRIDHFLEYFSPIVDADARNVNQDVQVLGLSADFEHAVGAHGVKYRRLSIERHASELV